MPREASLSDSECEFFKYGPSQACLAALEVPASGIYQLGWNVNYHANALQLCDLFIQIYELVCEWIFAFRGGNVGKSYYLHTHDCLVCKYDAGSCYWRVAFQIDPPYRDGFIQLDGNALCSGTLLRHRIRTENPPSRNKMRYLC